MEVKVEKNVSLAPFTTYKTGGPAAYFARADRWEKLFALREFSKKEGIPYLIVGGGSNILVSDKGYPGLVILNQMDKVNFHNDAVTAEGGANLTRVVLAAAQHNLGGIAGLTNVPGSVGGAIYGNAGIPGMWIGDVLQHAVILPTEGHKPQIVGPEYFEFGYRTSKLKRTKDLVLSATLVLKPLPKAAILTEIKEIAKMRSLKQPTGLSCGSFFKNPSEFPSAGWLIEQSGCKGMAVGGAMVSPKHANFFLNTGKATSSDILELAVQVHQKVKQKYNVTLEPEVQILPKNPFVL